MDVVLDGGPCAVGVESTIVELVGGDPVLLRPGGVTVEQLEATLGRRVTSAGGTEPCPGDARVALRTGGPRRDR